MGVLQKRLLCSHWSENCAAMADIFSFFSPQLGKKKSLKMKPVVIEDEVQKEEDEICGYNDKVTGIVNDNYDSFGEDDISVESLTVALFNLEEKKKSLEEEINNLYKSEIGYDDMLDLVTKILSISRVAIPSTIEDDDVADIDDCFDMLKTTATFVEKRLRKIKIKPKPEIRKDLEIELNNEVVENEDVTEGEELDDYNSCIEYKDDVELDSTSGNMNFEYNTLPNDDSKSESVETDKLSDSSSVVAEDSLGTKRVSYEDFVTSKDVLVEREKDRFGSKKTRWSLRRVFKKKSS